MSNWDWADMTANKFVENKSAPNHPPYTPDQVGGYHIGGLRIAYTKRPRWLTRFLMKWLVEWTWEDKV